MRGTDSETLNHQSMPLSATMSANRSLFVTHLAADVTEANLVNLFASFGPILSVKVCRDERRLSRGYGYVNFTTSSDARRAIDGLNFAQLNGQPIQVMVAQLEPTRRVSTDANVFVKNLDKSIDSKRLHELFAPFGPIVSSKLAQEVNGSSKGFGFVQYECEESAVRAIIALNGKQLAAKTIFCSKFMSKSLRQKALDTNKPKQLAVVYVKNLSADFDGQSLQELLEPYGRIDSAKVFHKNEKTFGFVSFESAMAANAAVLALHDKCLPNGSALYVSRVHSRVVPKKSADKQKTLKKRSDGRYVFVKYLHNRCTDSQLRQLFGPFGVITSAKVLPQSSQWSLQTNPFADFFGFSYGFVCFATPEAANTAVQSMNNALVAKRPLLVAIANRVDYKTKNDYLLSQKKATIAKVVSTGRQSLIKRLHV